MRMKYMDKTYFHNIKSILAYTVMPAAAFAPIQTTCIVVIGRVKV